MAQSDSLKASVEKATQEAAKTKVVTKAADKESIKQRLDQNTVAQVILAKMDDEAKVEALAKLMTMDKNKTATQNRELLEALAVFQDLEQEQRKENALEVVAMQKSDVFVTLQQNIKLVMDGLVDLKERLAPFTDILKAFHKLHSEEVTTQVYEEIQAYNKLEDKRKAELAAKETELRKAVEAVEDMNAKIRDLQTNKEYRSASFLGIGGGIKKVYQDQITIHQTQDLPQLQATVAAITAEVEALKVVTPSTTKFTDPEVLAAKEQMSRLLDLSTDKIQADNVALLQSAYDIITTSSERINVSAKAMAEHGKIIENLDMKVRKSDKIQRLISEASRKAADANRAIAAEFETPALPEGETESELAKITREQRKAEADEFIRAMTQTNFNSTEVRKSVAQEVYTVGEMKKKAEEQRNLARMVASNSIASTATSIASTLNAINSAGINQSAQAVDDVLNEINRTTSSILMDQSIVDANMSRQAVQKLKTYAEEMATLKQGVDALTDLTTTITKEGLDASKNLEEAAKEFGDSVGRWKAASTEAQKEFNAASNDNRDAATGEPAVKATPGTKKNESKLSLDNV